MNGAVTTMGQTQTQLYDTVSRNSLLGPLANDWEAIDLWLAHLRLRPVSDATLKSYTSELAKLRWYCEVLQHPHPSRWFLQDAIQFVKWLQEEAKLHVSTPKIAKSSPEWTPFKSVPSKASIATTLKVANALFKFWKSAGYIPANPLEKLGSQADKRPAKIRSIDPALIQSVITHMECSVGTAPTDFLLMVRNRFILLLLEHSGLRANEAIQADMDDIESVTDPKTQHMYWRLRVRFSKGGAETWVLLDDVVMDHLRIYRLAFGLPEMPAGHENIGLILSTRTKAITRPNGASVRYSAKAMRRMRQWQPIRRRQTLWDIIKGEFRKTADSMVAKGYVPEAQRIEMASTHWLRHTFGTRLVREGYDLRLVAQLMRHKNIRNTMRYTEQEFLDVARQVADTANP